MQQFVRNAQARSVPQGLLVFCAPWTSFFYLKKHVAARRYPQELHDNWNRYLKFSDRVGIVPIPKTHLMAHMIHRSTT